MVAVFNDCNMTISIANAQSVFVMYNKVIWYLIKGTIDAGCYSFIALTQHTRVVAQITVVKRRPNFMSTSANLKHEQPYSWYRF
jgi:hypothetical protein